MTNSLTERAEKIAGGHYWCDDSWYTCPKHPDGCSNKKLTECDCGLERKIKAIADLCLTYSNERVEEAAKVAERYRSPYTLKASENALSMEEVQMQQYVREEIAKAIRNLKTTNVKESSNAGD